MTADAGGVEKLDYKVPDWVLADDPNMCRLCLDTRVIVHEFHSVAEYCEHYGCRPEDLDRLEQYALSESYPFPYRVAQPCTCVKNRAQEARFKRALLTPVRREHEAAYLEGIQRHIPYKVQGLEVAKRVISRALTQERGFACFQGETQTGKTYVALAAVRGVTDGGGEAAFISSRDFCDKLRDRALDASRYVEELLKNDLIVLDDVGAERVGPAEGTVRDQYERFLKSFERRGVLLVTTNYKFYELLKGEELFGVRANTIIARLRDIAIAPEVWFGTQKL
jgi:DNA replication protein DnaC